MSRLGKGGGRYPIRQEDGSDIQSRGQEAFCEGPGNKYLDLASHVVSVTVSQLCHCSTKTIISGRGCAPVKPYLQKRGKSDLAGRL